MSLRVLTGSANAGKTRAIHVLLQRHIASGGRALLLLPSPADVAIAMRELAPACATGLEITTLGAHLDGCWRVVGDGRRLVTAVQRSIILEESGRSVEAGCLSDSASTPGFRRMLGSLVQRAAESDFMLGVAGPGGDDPGACVLRFIEAYARALEQAGLVERGEAYRTVARRAGALDLPGLIAVNRFTGLTRPQEHYIEAAATCSEVLLSLTYSESLPATEAAEALVARLESSGTVEEVMPPETRLGESELLAIERGFSASGRKPLVSTGAVIISEAWGRTSEAARIVAEVQDAQAAGIAPQDIAVVLRDPIGHMRALRLAFDEAGMLADWDMQIPFERTGFGRALLALLALCSGGADRVTWMDFMRSPYAPLCLEDLDEFDTRVRRLGLQGAAAVSVLESWLRGDAALFMRQAHRASANVADEGSEARWHTLAMTMLGCAHPSGAKLTHEGMIDAAAARSLVDAVAGLRELPYAQAPAHTLSAALRGSPVSIGGTPGGSGVQVMSAERVRGRRFECIIVGGLTAGEFPRVRRDEGYGAMGVDKALTRAGIDTAPRDDVAAERLLFYQVITRARQRLVLSRRAYDDQGQPLQPSIFLEEVFDLYGGRECESGSGVARTVMGLDPGCISDGAPCTLRRSRRSAVRGQCMASSSSSASTVVESHQGVTAHDALIRFALSEDTRAALQERYVFSVSDIETYLQCPYRWFIERVIRPTELDQQVDASSAGQVAHDVLARIYDRFIEITGEARITPDTLDRALELLPKVIEEVVSVVHTHSTQEALELRRGVRAVGRVLSADARLLPDFVPRYREWSFGMAEGDQPEPLDGYALRGRIDRIDCSDSHLLITDYKLGAVGSDRGMAKFAEKALVQLPLYAYVASQRLGLEVAGAIYRSITGDGMRGFVDAGLRGKPFVSTDVVESGGIDTVIKEARERAQVAVQGMRAGVIDARPAEGRCSPYCAARFFCSGSDRDHA
ncbi:MAG: PD-(D/E)XK nuclease family protein [Coriobacteriia bacterium]|nr:PD-(D/E)XK nuclease family protein [Coriobacteriia bacterium]